MPPSKNRAAWIDTTHGQLEVRDAPVGVPAAHQVLIRNHAVAVNPVDWIIQVAGGLAYRWLTYPAVLGSDVAGEVVAAGAAVTNFRVGDRVLAHVVGTDKDSNTAAEGAFQYFSVALEQLVLRDSRQPFPSSGRRCCRWRCRTAACGLFQHDFLGLRPSHHHHGNRPGRTVLVWGGSTSVGSQGHPARCRRRVRGDHPPLHPTTSTT